MEFIGLMLLAIVFGAVGGMGAAIVILLVWRFLEK